LDGIGHDFIQVHSEDVLRGHPSHGPIFLKRGPVAQSCPASHHWSRFHDDCHQDGRSVSAEIEYCVLENRPQKNSRVRTYCS